MNRAPCFSTFSIVALDPDTGDLGVATQSKYLAVGSVVPWARFNAGAIATQAWANASFGPRGLDLLEQDVGAIDTLERLIESDAGRQSRQVGVVDLDGTAAAFTGEECQEWAGHVTGAGYVCLGNILAGEEVVAAMAETFEAPGEEDFAAKLLTALTAGQEAGGDQRGMQSAALLVAREGGSCGSTSDFLVDLRVDDHADPIEELKRLYLLHGRLNP
ncbi:MAG: DUF1028 domain-containing protein [Gemmatimonadetes bacterium]|nr:DUF1028 domain-containing protein [Gemmatimonadota bacterium]MYH20418.1 DUF1028 domain-containing protein [Gemmatimonadota bacterium]MYK99254.1 DUF1028 domain-containing protein [Gemmatimonadota bacterium]